MYVRNGFLKSWNKYYADIETDGEGISSLIFRKKKFNGKVEIRLKLEFPAFKVYAYAENETDFIITIAYIQKLRIRTENPKNRVEWLTSLNKYTFNLTQNLSINECPIY